jgi:RNA polymerase sigma-70 factor (ECF subfamily)
MIVMDRAATFQAERPRLIGLAYRMLGSLADAEDVVSEAWLRFDAAEPGAIDRPKAWLTTVTSRLAIDRGRAQQRRREDYVGPWLPEPVRTDVPSVSPLAGSDPAAHAELAESLTMGFLVVLDRLGPTERAVFLLADVFDEPYADIAAAVGKSPEACRQIASRARRKVRDERAAVTAADDELVTDLVTAIGLGDVQGLLDMLSDDVVLVSDGGRDRHAARRPVVGPERVARFLVNLAKRMPEGVLMGIEQVNAASALVIRAPTGAIVMTADGDALGRISAVRLMLNPDKVVSLDGADPLR